MKRNAAILVLLLAGCEDPDPLDGGVDLASPVPVDASSARDAATDGAEAAQSFSFVVVGCNRLEKGDVTAGNPSTANLEQLQRTFTEVAAISPPPKFFFFAGDMVYGYQDATALETELKAWTALYEASPLPARGVQLVAVPGNHEVQTKNGSDKIAYVEAETTWVATMSKYILGSNGPKAGGADQLQTDQSRLTYSFDYAGTHFVVLDTDPVGADWQVPAYWVTADVAAAHAAGARHIFAIGHKPAWPSPVSSEGGLSMFPAIRDAFWAALENGHAEAMLAAHNHLWYKTRPGKTWQIVAGNGGSLLETGVTGADAYYGYTLVQVDASDRVTITSYGRDVPQASYFAPAPAAQYPTTVRDTVDATYAP